MRFGLTILPEHRWSEAAPMWRQADAWGFDHAWTYDHLTWAGLPDEPWFGTTPTLTAAAMVTQRVRLGTFVASPNYRHPVTFMRDLLALDDVSGGRIIAGLGTGGDLDARILGDPGLSVKQRVDRFEEFVTLLDRVLTQDHVDHDGEYFRAQDARSLPGCVQQPRIPFVMAANGPRSLRLAARFGAGWVTTGPQVDSLAEWFDAVGALSERLTKTLADAGRDAEGFGRYLNLDSSPQFSMESAGAFEDLVGRAAELGFTDVISHWPRPEGVYAGRREVLEEVATAVIPRLRRDLA